MPFRSESQRRFLWAKHPDIAQEFADHTPKGTKLPKHVKKPSKKHMKKAYDAGVLDALSKFAGEELRLRIPDRKFHGFDAAHRDADKSKKAGDESADSLVQLLEGLENPTNPSNATASKDPLDRGTAWGPPTNPAGGGGGGTSMAGLGQTGSIGMV